MEQEAGPGLTQASVWCRCLTDGLPSSGASRPGPLSSPHSASTPHCTPTEDAGEREDGEHAGLPRPRAKATDVVSEGFTKEHLSEARDCREAAIVFQSRGGLVLEAGRDSHLGAVGTSASVCMVQGVDTAPPRHPPPAWESPLRRLPPCLCSLPLLVHNCRHSSHRATDSVPPPLLSWRGHHTGRLFPQNLVRMRMGNPEEAPKPHEGCNNIFLVWSQTGPRPSVSPSSQ